MTAASPGARQRPLQAIQEERAVRQAGEGVMEGLMRELKFEGLTLSDVAIGGDNPADAGVGQQVV